MVNVLVLGISGNVSQGILKAIRLSKIPCKIIGACVNINTVGDLWCDDVYKSPYAREDKFISWLIEICNSENIDIVLTGVEENLIAIAANIDMLRSSCNSVFVVSEYEKLKIGQDKLLTCQWLEDNGFNYPAYAEISDNATVQQLLETYGYPLIVKPRHGKGSAGLQVVNNVEELHKCLNWQDYVIQEYVGNNDSEYTVSCYMDKNGATYKPIVLQRWLHDGATWEARVVDNTEIEQHCQEICQAFAPMGPLNIQLRLDNEGKPVPFELNVRFSGTTPMRANFGFRDVEAVINEYMYGKDVANFFSVKAGKVYRYVNEAYVWPKNGNSEISIDCTLEG